MISTSETNDYTRFFTHHWTITIPAHPSLKYIHTTWAHLDEWLALISNPDNQPYDDTLRTKVWDEAVVEDWKRSTIQKCIESQSRFNALDMLVELNGQIVGGANYFLLPTGEVNIGLMLNRNARGKGIGKLSMQVLIQLGHSLGIERLEVGTMKANQPMRALMDSLKVPGRDEIKESPERGVVAEILYAIPKTVDWEDIGLRIKFGAGVPKQISDLKI